MRGLDEVAKIVRKRCRHGIDPPRESCAINTDLGTDEVLMTRRLNDRARSGTRFGNDCVAEGCRPNNLSRRSASAWISGPSSSDPRIPPNCSSKRSGTTPGKCAANAAGATHVVTRPRCCSFGVIAMSALAFVVGGVIVRVHW